MKELTLETLFAVLEEMFGAGLFWSLLIVAIIVTIGYVYVLIRDRAVSMKKFLWAQICMPIGAVLAAWFVMASTDSAFIDLSGPLAYVVWLGVAGAGAVGCAILVYTLQSLIWPIRNEKKKA